jgi:hypothetical protein
MIYNVIMMVAAVAFFLIWIYFLIKRSPPAKNKPDPTWQAYAFFRDGIKNTGSKPETVISYGKTCFAYDMERNIVFIQTGSIKGTLELSLYDIQYFKLYRDGRVLEYNSSEQQNSFEEGDKYAGGICSDLHITITKTDGSEIILPFIDSQVSYEYAYKSALKAANQVLDVLGKATKSNI